MSPKINTHLSPDLRRSAFSESALGIQGGKCLNVTIRYLNEDHIIGLPSCKSPTSAALCSWNTFSDQNTDNTLADASRECRRKKELIWNQLWNPITVLVIDLLQINDRLRRDDSNMPVDIAPNLVGEFEERQARSSDRRSSRGLILIFEQILVFVVRPSFLNSSSLSRKSEKLDQ